MAQRFKGKVAIITGSSSSEGLGYGIAYRIAQEGGHVVITSETKARVDKAVNDIKKAGFSVSGFVGDIGKASDRKALIQHTLEFKNRIDEIVVNNAVYLDHKTVPEASDVSDSSFTFSVKAGWEFVEETTEYIPRGGSILFVSSVVGYHSDPSFSLDSLTKTAILGLSTTLAKELSPKHIRVSTLSALDPSIDQGDRLPEKRVQVVRHL